MRNVADGTRLLQTIEKAVRTCRGKPGKARCAKLGDVVQQLMDNSVSPRQGMFEYVSAVWSQLLPAELHRHCRVTDVTGGQVKILVDSPSYMHELRMCHCELLAELQRRCPQARIKRIKMAIG